MRKAMAFPVRFVAEGQIVQTTSRDLDEQSVFVRCVEPPADDEKVGLRLYLPGLATAETISALVSESGPDGFRARFADLDDQQRSHIAQALAGAALEGAPVDPVQPFAGENRRFLPRFLDRFRVTMGVGQHK